MGALGRNLQCVLCYAEKLLKHLNTCFLFSVQAFLDVVKRTCFLAAVHDDFCAVIYRSSQGSRGCFSMFFVILRR